MMARNRGSVLGTVLAVGVLLAAGVLFVIPAFQSLTKGSAVARETIVAQGFAGELIEYFSSNSTERLIEHFKLNPVNGTTNAYKLCAHINFLVRAGEKVKDGVDPALVDTLLNRDPLAALPASTLLGDDANRYYMVRILNIATLQFRDDLCDVNIRNITLSANEWFYLTSGVSWKSPTDKTVKRVVLSTVVPRGGAIETTPPPAFDIGTGFNGTVKTIAPVLDGSGDIYVGGDFTSYKGTSGRNRIARLNNDGSYDTGFNPGTGFNLVVNDIVLTTDGTGDIIVGGDFTSYKGTTENRIVRLQSDGTERTSLGGININYGTGFNIQVYSLALDGTNLFVGGGFTQYQGSNASYLVKLDQYGAKSPTFNPGTSFSGDIRTVYRVGDGDVLLGGSFTQYGGSNNYRAIKLNPDATKDTAWSLGTNGPLGTVHSILGNLDDSAFYVAGAYTNIYSSTKNRIIRLLGTGAIDTSFSIGSGFNNEVKALALQTDGSIYAVGYFTTYNGTGADYLARITPSGALDAAFPTNNKLNNNAWAVARAVDGSADIFVGGEFTSYDGTSKNRIARIKSDGTLR